MQMIGSDPTVEGLVSSIHREEIDLQPDFQRGEVWSVQKQQRLVDTILRGWHIPPIHLVEVPGKAALEVLDGQQRLRAIERFLSSDLPIDGAIQPHDDVLASLNGKYYKDIDDPILIRRIRTFPIRQFVLRDYNPQEPAELFYRLNQPALLTGAEKRNAFFGPARSEIKSLVETLESFGVGREFIGFSNSRMAYEDVLSRLALMVRRGTSLRKITAGDLADWYRRSDPLQTHEIILLRRVVELFAGAKSFMRHSRIRLNKATFLSWLWFTTEYAAWFPEVAAPRAIAGALDAFEEVRRFDLVPSDLVASVLELYADRSTSRVSDVSSVLLREAALWYTYVSLSSKGDLNRADTVPYLADLLRFGDNIAREPELAERITASFVNEHADDRIV